MTRFKLDRRTVIKGAGTIAIALPWLEIMGRGSKAHAQTAGVPLKRFITVYQPGGAVRSGANGDKYTPTGSETAFTLSPVLAPLANYQSRLLVVDGTNLTCGDQSKYGVEQHQGGEVGWLTGAIQQGAGNYIPKMYPSIDQVLAPRLSTGKPYASLQLAVRWATGKSHGKLSPINAMNFSDTGPIPPRLDPQDIFMTLFGASGGTGAGGAGGGPDPTVIAANRRKSILDFVDKKYAALETTLGTEDRARLDQHLTEIRSLEQRMMTISMPPPTTGPSPCKTPIKVDTTGYSPTSGLNSADDGSIKDTATDSKIPAVGQFMMDMMAMAMACERTNVISLQWSDSEAKHTFPWLNLSEHHHYYQHDGGFRPTECAQIDTWYSQMHAYLLKALAAIDMGGHSLLDETVVFFGTEIADPPSHGKTNMPFLLAGGDGKTLRTGRWIKCGGVPHNRLLTSILNVFGDTRATFGDARVDSSVLASPSLT
ncbi:MAG: DUF1552 domain-containing protein [Verrucomicrobiota bacterium]